MTEKSGFSWQQYNKAPIVGIFRNMSSELIHRISETYREAGLTTLEVTMNTKGASDIIRSLRETFTELNIGAGTVITMDDLDKALESGAQFIVTPVIKEEVIKSCVSMKIPVFPGAFSPTEIYNAWELGASAVKVFPATQLGPGYIKAVAAPLNEIKLVPTGGVSIDNVKSFFQAGAVGVGVGSTLFDPELIKSGDYEGLKKFFMNFLEEIDEFVS
jgi:2-dehydro-3-deoxyphosphogluconate aldolase/(4S)-4-hydroxy-2-oxoglutarate aldolase